MILVRSGPALGSPVIMRPTLVIYSIHIAHHGGIAIYKHGARFIAKKQISSNSECQQKKLTSRRMVCSREHKNPLGALHTSGCTIGFLVRVNRISRGMRHYRHKTTNTATKSQFSPTNAKLTKRHKNATNSVNCKKAVSVLQDPLITI